MRIGLKEISFLIPATVAVILVLLVILALDYSVRSESCESCHRTEARYSDWLIGEKAKEGFSHDQIACADCHFEGAPQGLLSAKFKSAAHAVSNIIPFLDPRESRMVSPVVERIPSANCRLCHLSFDKINEMHPDELPDNLKEIGLAMEHEKHSRIAVEECAGCHERFKAKDGELFEDKGVNYREYSHMTCDSCHKYVAHAYKKFENLSSNVPYDEAIQSAWGDLNKNRRWRVDIPSEKSCRRCHSGKFHFQKKIFLADKIADDNYQNCVKCHPSMTRDFFKEFKARVKGS